MAKGQAETHKKFKNPKQDKITGVSGFNYEEPSKLQCCSSDWDEAMKVADVHESCTVSDCSHCGFSKDRSSTQSFGHHRRSVNATNGVINDMVNVLAVDNAESLGSKHVSHEHSSAWHKSYVSSWLRWLDEPELMIQEGSTIHSTSSDGILAEINASIVCHQTADSLFSTTSDFTNYRGLLNWCFMLLTLSTGKAALENIIHSHLWNTLPNDLRQVDMNYEHSKWLLHNCLFRAHIAMGLVDNLYLYGVLIDSEAWCAIFTHWTLHCPSFLLIVGLNVFILAALRIERKIWQGAISENSGFYWHILNLVVEFLLPALVVLHVHPNPVLSSNVLALAVIVFLKLVSFIQVNSWCRCYTLRSKSCRTTLQIYYFLFAPTLCYDFNFPRSERIRKRFLTKRLIELIFMPILIISLIQQWIIPIVDQSRTSFEQKDISGMMNSLLSLTLPNHIIWLMCFYWFFHSVLNVTAELLRFGDRVFYRDWWNAETVQYFWQNWNIPAHKWALRHMYQPLRRRGYSKSFANVSVFLVSACFHEYLVSIPLRMFRVWAFSGILAQVPLMWLTANHLNGKTGNLVVWMTVMILQPVGIFLYYHDYYILNA